METPTLEEVKEHFKNAKIIKWCNTDMYYELNGYETIKENINEDTFHFLINGSIENEECYNCIYGDGEYAEIIKYKELEPIKPKHYEVSITNRKTKESINCDYIDIAKGLGLTNAQFLALRYFRKKGDLDKQINDTKKGIESYKAHLENLELLKLKNE